MSNIFQASEKLPFHISVGAVLVNSEGKVLVHKMERAKVPAEIDMGNLDEAYILMRETLEPGESIEQGVLRGIQEEFGATGTIEGYLGSLQLTITAKKFEWEKTTLYFLVSLIELGERNMQDEESYSILEWIEPELLIERMRDQGARCSRTDLDESKIIEAYVRTR